MEKYKRTFFALILLTVFGSFTAYGENRSDSKIIHDAIKGNVKDTYWLLMSSTIAPSGYEKMILVSGFWDNYQACEELKIWGKSNPLRKHRKFRCEKVPGR